MQEILTIAGWIGMGLSVMGTHFQSKLDMRTAFKWFLCADVCLIGIQIYLHVWPQVILFLVFFYMSAKGLIKTYHVNKFPGFVSGPKPR